MANVNITLSADERLVERVREIARDQGTTLNDMVRRYLETVGGERNGEALAAEFLANARKAQGHSRGWKWNRLELYEERMKRFDRARLP